MTPPKTQLMKPETAAKKLGIYLPAAPAEFREGPVSRDRLDALMSDPPEWLTTLHADGPHPRPVVAGKLGVSIAGLTRGGVDEALTSEQIQDLLADQPAWLAHERGVQAEVRAERQRIAERDAERRARQDGPGAEASKA